MPIDVTAGGTFDAEATMRLVAGSVRTMQQRYNNHTVSPAELRQYVRHAAMVCGWAPAETGKALLAALVDPAGPDETVPIQRGVSAEVVQLTEQLTAAVATLEGDAADHDQRVEAAETAATFQSTGIIGSAYYPEEKQWWAAARSIRELAGELLRAQPLDVRQTLFDRWTAIEAKPHLDPRRSLIGAMVAGGGVDGRGWLDRLGACYLQPSGDWTEQIIRAEHGAGRPHPLALATWRRMQVEDGKADTGSDLWPVPNPGEPWADRAVADVEATAGARRSAWQALLAHCVPGKDQARPAAAWRRQAGSLLDAVGADEFATVCDGWLGLVGAPRSGPGRLPDRYNVRLLSGLLWVRAMCPPSEDYLRNLGQIVERATRKISGHGPASPKLANAAVLALLDTDRPAAVAQLARLASRLTYKSTLRLVEKGLDERATALGIAREDVEEMALPGYGLPLGDDTYSVEIRGTTAVLTWHDADRKDELKELTATVKDISATLVATRDRLDTLLRRDRVWTVEQWRERFLDHPLARTLARRLIWTVDGVACGWADDALRGPDDTVIEIKDDFLVRLWHPAVADPATVAAWRAFLARHGITQPFKQAHREQYLLTEAERATGTYSNRFAAHIVRQHHLNALLSRRGWSYRQHRNDGASYEPPRLALPGWDLRAELSIAGIDDRGDGVFDTMATDQLRFLAPDGRPLPLVEVPPVVLSEVMRDVDLFVAVAGVGSDPNWYDGGPQGRHREYWARHSFGALTPPGETRREVLAALIPALTIADRCTLTDRFLEVRGDLHTYRIHCGSGNILIAPQDRYLCIIPASAKRPAEQDLFMPFEGDGRLAEIIGKALLLAADKKIKDPVILHQL
ncbi:DUF4132 domain-containing protein [Actinoplanes sp. NPDC020271]|uniref:DUF4132 domain-containing protein n=1 Tax=Actinoplanes sp. NPDC020271 TaxID=3363896 RepID=UPI0037957848